MALSVFNDYKSDETKNNSNAEKCYIITINEKKKLCHFKQPFTFWKESYDCDQRHTMIASLFSHTYCTVFSGF